VRERDLARRGPGGDGARDPPRRRGRPPGPARGAHPEAPVRAGLHARGGTGGVLSSAVDELFDRWERAWSGRHPDAFAPLCEPDVSYEDPLTPEPLAGAAEIGAHAQKLWRAFPDARLERTGERLSDGRFAAAPAKLLGTHRDAIGSYGATHRFVVVHVLFYCELRDERLLHVRSFFDAWSAAVELGVLPRPGTIGERALLMVRGFGIRR
jgi:hypothetical protein